MSTRTARKQFYPCTQYTGLEHDLNGGSVAFAPTYLHFPLEPQVRTQSQQATLETLYNAQLQLFILATASGFIGCRGTIGQTETYQNLHYRCDVTEAAEDLKAIAPYQNRFEIVSGELPEAVQLVGMADSLPRWIAVFPDSASNLSVVFDRMIDLINEEEPDPDYQVGTLQQLLRLAGTLISSNRQDSVLSKMLDVLSSRLSLDEEDIHERLLGHEDSEE